MNVSVAPRALVLSTGGVLALLAVERWTRPTRGGWHARDAHPDFADLLLALASWLLLGAAAWLALVLAVTSLQALLTTPAHGWTGVPIAPAGMRRWLLVFLGGALVAGLAGPSYADGPLPSPGRVPGAAPPPRASAPPPASVVVVRAGDSLWSIVRAQHPAAGDAEIADRVRALAAANRAEIGPDPDVIRPGQRLRPPDPPHRTEETP